MLLIHWGAHKVEQKMDCVSDGFEVQRGKLTSEGIQEGPDCSNGVSREEEVGSLSILEDRQ